jgi:hypothetical protein
MQTKVESDFDLAVCHRIYPRVSDNPIFGFKDKLAIAQLDLETFKTAVGDLKIRMWVLLDNCPPVYEEIFSRLWSQEDLVLMRHPGAGDAATGREQVRILMEQTDADAVYFAESDYFYLSDQFPLAVNFLRQNPDANFVSPHDHSDIYATDLHKLPRIAKIADGKTWNSRMSTTHAFLTTRKKLQECRWAFLASHRRVSPDLSKWMALTKRRAFNPIAFARWAVSHRFWRRRPFLRLVFLLAANFVWTKIHPLDPSAIHRHTHGCRPGGTGY